MTFHELTSHAMTSTIRQTSAKTDDGMHCTLQYQQPDGARERTATFMELTLDNPERCKEFIGLLQRALNTMEDPPEWALSLMDYITLTPSPLKPMSGPPHPNNTPPEVAALGVQLEAERKTA